MIPAPVTRERKKAKVRNAIIRAAVDLFERQGFERTLVDEIAATAEVSTRTFFRYFPTKEAVMFPYHAAYVEELRRLLGEHRAAGSPLEAVRRALGEMARVYMEARGEHLRHQRIIRSSPALTARSVTADAEWETELAEAWRNGSPRSAAGRRRARLIAGAVMGTVNAVMAEWYENDCRDDLVKLGESALALLEHGIGDGGNGRRTA